MRNYFGEDEAAILRILKEVARIGFPEHGREQADLDGAVSVLQSGIKKFPRSYDLHQHMCLVLSANGKKSEVLEYLEPLVSEYPEDADLFDLLLGYYVYSPKRDLNNKGWALAQKMSGMTLDENTKAHLETFVGDLKNRIGCFTKDELKDIESILEKAEGFSSRKSGVTKGFDPDGAAVILQEGIEKYPDSVKLRQHLHFTLRAQGKAEEGVEMLQCFAEGRPKDFDAQLLLLKALVDLPKYKGNAFSHIEKLLSQPRISDNQRKHIESYAGYVGYSGKDYQMDWLEFESE